MVARVRINKKVRPQLSNDGMAELVTKTEQKKKCKNIQNMLLDERDLVFQAYPLHTSHILHVKSTPNLFVFI